MKITENIRNALKLKIEAYGFGGQAILAGKIGLKPSYISRIRLGKTKEITDGTWKKIKPHIKEYLDEENMEIPKYNSKYTKLLINSFEQLKSETQQNVLNYADELLESECVDMESSVFTEEELELLYKHGIECKYNEEFSISPLGLAWIYNVINYLGHNGKVLSNSLFKDLLKAKLPVNTCRELRIKTFQIDVYNDSLYEQLTIYLNGSPPRSYTTHFLEGRKISHRVTLNLDTKGLPFRIAENNILYLDFTDEDLQKLNNSETLKIALI